MNLPQLTAQLGALERSGQDVLHSLVKPLKFKRKENESYYAVYLTIDLAQDSIVFENPFPYDESLLKRIYYFGNNSAAASQTYLVRSTDSLHYLLTSVWNDLYISLQQNGMSASRLAQLLQHLHSRSFVSLGSKKGQGRLVLEKIRFPAALAGPSISYNPDEKCVVINDIKYKSEAFLNLLLENENKKNRVVLIIPKIRDGHEEYLLSQHEDYHELVKKINKLDDNHSAAENLRDGGRVCYLCHQVKPDVSSSYSTKFSRSGINKIFTITTINAARFNRDGYSYDDSYSICGSCYQDLITGEKVVESQFRGRIAGESVFILPEHLLESFDYSSIGAIKKDMDIAFNSFEINEWLTAVENDASWLSSNLYMVHFIIYRTDGNSVSILEAIEDVPTLRIVRIMKLLRDYANRVKPHIKGLSLASIYRMIPVRETEKGQIDIGRVLSLYKAILSGELIRTETLYGYACEALDKGMRQLHKARMDNYRNLNLIQYANGREDYFIKSTVLSYVVLLQTLQHLKLLDRSYSRQEVSEMTDDIGVNQGAKTTDCEPAPASTIEQMEQFLEMNQFTPEAKALFYLGAMIQRVAIVQYKNGYKSKPILKKIQFQGMKQHEIIRLSNDVLDKFRQYRIFDTYAEALLYRHKASYGMISNNWPLSEQANVFYLMSGYGFAVGNRAGKEAAPTDESDLEVEAETVL